MNTTLLSILSVLKSTCNMVDEHSTQSNNAFRCSGTPRWNCFAIYNDSYQRTGYMALCFAIEYSKAFPKLRGILSRDPHVPIGGVTATTHEGSSNTPAYHANSLNGSLTEPLVGSSDAMDSIIEDVDVAAEAARVERMFGRAGAQDGAEVVLNGLRKVYRTKQVRGVSCDRASVAMIVFPTRFTGLSNRKSKRGQAGVTCTSVVSWCRANEHDSTILRLAGVM